MPGFVKNPFQFIKNSELFVLSSRWEGLPTVLIEAMCCNIQVISTDCPGGSSYILEGGKWGQLVEVGNINELAKAIRKTIEKKAFFDTQTRSEDFDKEKVIKNYLELIK